MKIKSKGLLFTTLAALAIAIGVVSCKKDLLNVNVPMQMAEITLTLPITPAAGEVTLPEDTIATNIDKFLSDNKIKKENIKSIKIESMVATIVPDSSGQDTINNFRVMQNVKTELAAGSGSFFTLSEVSNIPNVPTYTLDLKPNKDTDYTSYFSSSLFRLRTTILTRSPIFKPIKMKVSIKLNLVGGV